MLQVEPTGQRGRMITRNGQNVLEAEKKLALSTSETNARENMLKYVCVFFQK